MLVRDVGDRSKESVHPCCALLVIDEGLSATRFVLVLTVPMQSTNASLLKTLRHHPGWSDALLITQSCAQLSSRQEGPRKRVRRRTSDPSPPRHRSQLDTLHDSLHRSQQQGEGSVYQSPNDVGRLTAGGPVSPRTSESLQRQESIMADFGQSESAMDITRRVCVVGVMSVQ